MLDFPHKTPSNFYGGDTGFGLSETKNEGDIWLSSLPYDAILVRSEVYFLALESGYSDFDSGLKDGLMYHILIPKKEAKQ